MNTLAFKLTLDLSSLQGSIHSTEAFRSVQVEGKFKLLLDKKLWIQSVWDRVRATGKVVYDSKKEDTDVWLVV